MPRFRPEELGIFLDRADPDQQVLCADLYWRPGGGGSGSVTSVGLAAPAEFIVSNSPVTTTGTLTLAWDVQSSATFFAGPLTGPPGTPGFRAIAPTDLAGTPTAGWYWDGTGVWTILPAPGTGTVTSVDVAVPAELLSSGGPITTNGTITLSWVNESQNRFFAGPASGPPGTPGFRSIVALDIGTGTADATKYLRGDLTWQVTPLGSVTSVDVAVPGELQSSGGPITTSGTITLSWTNETANRIFAGPASGPPGTPGFRAMVVADMATGYPYANLSGAPTIPTITGSSVLKGSSGNAVAATSADVIALWTGTPTGAKFLRDDGVLAVPSGTATGTVTSVGLSLPSIFTVTVTPITTSGTLTAVLATQSANSIFAGPTTGAAAAPTFRTAVAEDVATGTPTTGYIPYSAGAGTKPVWGSLSLPPPVNASINLFNYQNFI